MANFISKDELKVIKVLFMAGDGPDSTKVYGMNKCLIPIKGKPALEYMLDVFHDIGSKNIYIAGDERELKDNLGSDKNVNYIDCKGALSTKISKILSEFQLGKDEPLLFMQGDTPLFNKRSLLYFLDRCDLDNADFFHPFAPKECIEFFNDYFNRRYMFTKDIDTRLNCMTLLKPRRCNFRYVQDIADNRKVDSQDKDFGNYSNPKNFLMTAFRALGPGGFVKVAEMLSTLVLSYSKYHNLFKFMKNRTTVADIEKYVSRAFKARVNAVITPYAEGTLDLDSQRDADTYINHMDQLEARVKQEHELIDYFEENIEAVSSIAHGYLSSARASHKKTDYVPLRIELKKEYYMLKKVFRTYSKKGLDRKRLTDTNQ